MNGPFEWVPFQVLGTWKEYHIVTNSIYAGIRASKVLILPQNICESANLTSGKARMFNLVAESYEYQIPAVVSIQKAMITEKVVE